MILNNSLTSFLASKKINDKYTAETKTNFIIKYSNASGNTIFRIEETNKDNITARNLGDKIFTYWILKPEFLRI